jgi:hypothetical protein
MVQVKVGSLCVAASRLGSARGACTAARDRAAQPASHDHQRRRGAKFGRIDEWSLAQRSRDRFASSLFGRFLRVNGHRHGALRRVNL